MSVYPVDPPLECDLVMKGGVTSGIIYPRAVCELAQTYRLRSIGGASAGAIAAAAAAAAEFGRAKGGFDRLQGLPTQLAQRTTAGRSVLFDLFQPDRDQHRLFSVLTAASAASGAGSTKLSAALRAAATAYWRRSLVGASPGVAVGAAGVMSASAWGWAAGLVGAGTLMLVGSAAAVATGLVSDLNSIQRFGLCSGMSRSAADGAGVADEGGWRSRIKRGGRRSRSEGGRSELPATGVGVYRPALTQWLHDEIQALAGLEPHDDPLTFGQLHARGIELRMMTTNLTRGEPVTLPWTNEEHYFNPSEFEDLFPDSVLTWMRDHPPTQEGSADERFKHDVRAQASLPLLPWPSADDLPVVVAARMSLSFPGLIQAIPLYSANFSDPAFWRTRTELDQWVKDNRRETYEPDDVRRAVRDVHVQRREANWFSDGGICSNLPVHMFDSPLPTRPTFAVNLDPFPVGRGRDTNEDENSRLPDDSGSGRYRPWKVISDDQGLAGFAKFGSAIVGTARNWVDNQQMIMPGYRGRVVTVFQAADEGGLNLDMDQATVLRLADRGAGAGRRLKTKFAGADPGLKDAPGWTAHRWIRLRLSLAGYQQWLGQFSDSYLNPKAGVVRYEDLFGLTNPTLGVHQSTPANRAKMAERTRQLVESRTAWTDGTVLAGAPSRRPVLRLAPQLDETRA